MTSFLGWLTMCVVCSCIAVEVYRAYRKWKSRQQMERTVKEIPFKRFVSLYQIAPDKWDLKENIVTYVRRELKSWPTLPDVPSSERIVFEEKREYRFCFSVVDQWRYSMFLKRQKEEKEREAYVNETKQLVAYWQEDIDRYVEKGKEDISKLQKVVKNVDK